MKFGTRDPSLELAIKLGTCGQFLEQTLIFGTRVPSLELAKSLEHVVNFKSQL